MGPLSLRWYQSECIAAIFAYVQSYSGNPICALPTGTGKSVVIAEFCRIVFSKAPFIRVLMLTHVKELISQNYAELKGDPIKRIPGLWPQAPAGIYSAGLGKKEIRPITFAGIKSVVGNSQRFGHIDIIIIDECHMVSPNDETSYQTVIAELKAINPLLRVIGFTATPYRLGQGLLTEATERNGQLIPPIFTDICYDITKLEHFNRLIDEGYLAPLFPRPTAFKLDVENVDVRGGEFVQGQLQAAVDKDEVTYAAVEEAIRLAQDRRHWLVFATGTRHCAHVASCFESFGIKTATVHSESSDGERDEAFARFESGDARALINNNIATTGYNFKPLDCIIDFQPTSSPSKHVQKYGRGTRVCEGKENCLVLDFAGNTRRIGPINDPKIPRRKRRAGEGEGEEERQAPVRICPIPTCQTYNHARAAFCICCKHEFPLTGPKIDIEAGTEEIIVGAAPQIEIFPVSKIEYRRHDPHPASKKPPSLKVEYHSGFRQFSQWICLEHEGYPSKKAREWWRAAAGDEKTPPPTTVADALTRLEVLHPATHLKVWINRKDPQIMALDYSGSAFGTQIPQLF